MLMLAAAIGVLVGWFGRPLWLRIAERARDWFERRRRPKPAPGGCLNLASLAETYKLMYAPDTATQMANHSPIAFSELRKRKFHVVGAIDSGRAVTYPGVAAEVEAAIAAAHEELAKAAEAQEPLMYRSQREPGEVVGLDAWIPSSKPPDEAG